LGREIEASLCGSRRTIRDQQAQIAAAKDAIDAQVAAKVDEERDRIAAAEAQKAKRLVATDLDHKVKRSPTSTTCCGSAMPSSPKPSRPRPT
jgi:hypothetical protein